MRRGKMSSPSFFSLLLFVTIFIITTSAPSAGKQTEDKLLSCAYSSPDNQWMRHPSNCSRFFICDNGEAREMPSCQHGHVFSIIAKLCVPANSGLDDCNENLLEEIARELEESSGQDLELTDQIFGPGTSDIKDDMKEEIKLQLQPIPGPTRKSDASPVGVKSEDGTLIRIDEICREGGPLLVSHPENCAWYYNCTLESDTLIFRYYEKFTQECPYPQLFSEDTMTCEDFEDVQCYGKYEPKSPCDYRVNQCGKTAHCTPCWVRYGSCLGRRNGPNSWPDFEWKPFFVECYGERTVYQGACDRTTVFSPLTRACESPYSIPREHGGWRPDCSGRANGNFADEHGRCDFYYECKSGEYIGTYECTDGKMFNPIEGSCDDPNYVPYPCGDGEMPNVCLNKKNGLYLDIYGRCSHYFECRHEQFLGLSMCPAGAYNPERGDCDNSGLVAKPCGMKINPCEKKKDRYYADIESHCIGYYMCERGLMIAKFACQSGTMFNEDNLECEDVTTTPPPCGLAPDCKNTTDGQYPAMHRGSQFYYVCKDEIVDAIRACSLDEGGFVFDPIKRRCDFPRNVCRPLGTKVLGCPTPQEETFYER